MCPWRAQVTLVLSAGATMDLGGVPLVLAGIPGVDVAVTITTDEEEGAAGRRRRRRGRRLSSSNLATIDGGGVSQVLQANGRATHIN